MSATAVMSALEWEARVAESNGKWLAHWIKTTDNTQLNWTPEINGHKACRSVLEQASECVSLLNGAAAVLRGEAWPSPGGHDGPQFSTGHDACDKVIEAANNFAATLRKCDDGVWDRVYKLPWGDMPGSMVISLAVGNLQYHGGQINAIQMMLGDEEFHYPMD